MVGLVVTEPAEETELKTRFKYANLAAEVLTCGDPTIIDKLVRSSNLLHTLYKWVMIKKIKALYSIKSKIYIVLIEHEI